MATTTSREAYPSGHAMVTPLALKMTHRIGSDAIPDRTARTAEKTPSASNDTQRSSPSPPRAAIPSDSQHATAAARLRFR
jgi:hypothetical protein